MPINSLHYINCIKGNLAVYHYYDLESYMPINSLHYIKCIKGNFAVYHYYDLERNQAYKFFTLHELYDMKT